MSNPPTTCEQCGQLVVLASRPALGEPLMPWEVQVTPWDRPWLPPYRKHTPARCSQHVARLAARKAERGEPRNVCEDWCNIWTHPTKPCNCGGG